MKRIPTVAVIVALTRPVCAIEASRDTYLQEIASYTVAASKCDMNFAVVRDSYIAKEIENRGKFTQADILALHGYVTKFQEFPTDNYCAFVDDNFVGEYALNYEQDNEKLKASSRAESIDELALTLVVSKKCNKRYELIFSKHMIAEKQLRGELNKAELFILHTLSEKYSHEYEKDTKNMCSLSNAAFRKNALTTVIPYTAAK